MIKHCEFSLLSFYKLAFRTWSNIPYFRNAARLPLSKINCKFVAVHITAVLRSSRFDIFSEQSLPASFNRWSIAILFYRVKKS